MFSGRTYRPYDFAVTDDYLKITCKIKNFKKKCPDRALLPGHLGDVT